MGRDYYIYSLSCPLDGQVYYVGETINTLSQRLDGHMARTGRKNHNPAFTAWKQALAAQGLRPVITLLETTGFGTYAERRWTLHYQRAGAPLLNIHNMLLAPTCCGYDLWEANDLLFATGRQNYLIYPEPNVPRPILIKFFGGNQDVPQRHADSIMNYMRSLPTSA